MKNKKINIRKKLSKFNDYWSPKVVAEMNDYQFKLAKISDPTFLERTVLP